MNTKTQPSYSYKKHHELQTLSKILYLIIDEDT